MQLKGIHHIALNVKDLDRAEEFYTDVLGFQVTNRFSKGLRHLMLETGNAAIALFEVPELEVKEAMNILSEEGYLHFAFEANPTDFENIVKELQSKNMLLRFSGANENSGETYDAGTLAIQINEAWKSSEFWYQDFFTGFITGKLAYAMDDEAASKYGRMLADNIDEFGNVLDASKPSLPKSDSDIFNSLKSEAIMKNIANGGARVIDKSSMYNLDFNYNFDEMVISSNNIKINDKNNLIVNDVLKKIMFNKDKLQNKIYIKNLMKKAIKAYVG